MNEFRGIQVPSGITFKEGDNGSIRMHINQPQKNMQSDDAAFESWSLILRSQEQGADKIELSYQIYDSWSPQNGLKFPSDAEKQHFMRFLFRLWKFQESMHWFVVQPGECSDILEQFIELFQSKQMINNIPGSDPGISESPAKKEHIIENIFARIEKAKEHILKPDGLILPDKIFNQLPCGLFEDTVCKENRVFPTGFFDLWGVDQNNDLWLFELKDENNRAAGIISELFFYANYALQVFFSKTFNKKRASCRGYKELLEASENGINRIHACFLSPNYHTEIWKVRNDIREALNDDQTRIIYDFLKYDHSSVLELSKEL